MAKLLIKDVSINYSCSGTSKDTVVLLHGWGQNMTMMVQIENHLADRFTVYNIDLPGFGKSDTPLIAWSVYDYADCLKQFMDRLSIYDPIIIAHSFGARLAIILAANNDISKMVLTGAAGIKDKRHLDYYIKVYSYKLAKNTLKIFGLKKYQEQLSNNAGSSDYQNTSGVMRATFVKIVNEDLTKYLSDIKAEVLLVWGEKDMATPLWMGKMMAELIPNAGLAIFENDDHYAYYNQTSRFLKVLDIFLSSQQVD